jgi:hypothetical protein
MIRTIALLLALASPAAADPSVKVWPGMQGATEPSTITLHAPTDPAAVATITFVNTQVHGADEVFDLSWEGIEVTIYFEWNADESPVERIEVIPPDGYIAVPPVLDVQEHTTGTVQIIPYLGG